MLNFSQPQAFITARLQVEGKTYEIETFRINFTQACDFKGQPQHETKSHPLVITLSQTPDMELLLWAKKSTLVKSGEVIFSTDLGMTVYRIAFENAYCITLKESVDSTTGAKTAFMLSAERLTLNDVEHDNFWKK